MTNATTGDLTPLHTAAIDARNGYQEALQDAEGKGLSALFRQMIRLHDQNAAELKAELAGAGTEVEDNGSFMSTVHRTIMNIRSLFGGLDESVLPGLIDGEERNVKGYDEALAKDGLPQHLHAVLQGQRDRLLEQIAQMKSKVAA